MRFRCRLGKRRPIDAHGLSGIAFSGYGSEADLEASQAAGFVEHLTKPLDWDRLRQAIARVLLLNGSS